MPTLVTLVVLGLTKLLVSSWTTLLTPTLVTWSVDASGWEIDLTSSSFESILQQELVQSGAALVRGNSSEIIDIGGVLSGIAAAEYSFGTSGIFDFNGVRYNISTVPTHLAVNFPKDQEIQGLDRAYTLQQQGLTANMSCHQTNGTAGDLNLSSSFYPIPVLLANGTTDYWLLAWNITVVCAIDPLVTTSLVTYSGGVVNSTIINSQPLGSGNLTQFLAAIIDYQSRNAQGLSTNSVGDALYSLYVSASSNNSTSAKDVTNLLLSEMEQYWRGVIEFSGTFLRSASSVYPCEIPLDARIALSGHETIMTMGWYRRSATYGYTIIPITIVALMMYAAVAYTLWHVFIERGHESFTTFDPSNPIHVMMVSSARGSDDAKDDLYDFVGWV
ncbi:hypothetical protein J3R83DRAFT_11896 [Lanmaoa asiatica]|nr:hypothetical protein J3R83DRAFT_11896 [Lanmaoa asiatica]